MKQRIRVAGIVRNEEGILVLKRSRGRSDAPAFWELPTGKINFGEQPEEAMVRILTNYTGLAVSSIELKDVITFLALEGSSQLGNLYIIYEVSIKDKTRLELSGRWTAYKFIKDLTNGGIKLNEASTAVLRIEEEGLEADKSVSREVANSATVYVDGASRGNPGLSGVGYCIFSEDGQVLKRGGRFIGFATSRMAEYYALKEGIQQAIDLGLKSVKFVSDSLMVVNQMNGIFQVKNQDIRTIYKDIKVLLNNFEAVAFMHVPRLQNVAADKEANLAIDCMLDEKVVL